MRTVTFLPGWVGSSDSIVHRPGRAVAHDSYRWPSQLALGGQGLQQLPMGAARKTQITDHRSHSHVAKNHDIGAGKHPLEQKIPRSLGPWPRQGNPNGEKGGGVADDRLRPSQSQSRRVGDTPPSAQTTEGNQLQASPTSWPQGPQVGHNNGRPSKVLAEHDVTSCKPAPCAPAEWSQR